MNTPTLAKRFAFASALTLLVGSASAAVSTWDNGSTDGNWDTAGNWDNGVPTASDQAVISNGDTVTKTGDITLDDVVSSSDDGLQLTHGTLNVTGNYSTTTTGGANSSVTSNIGNGTTAGSLDIAGTLSFGLDSTSSSAVASFNIYNGSSVSANAFQGLQRGFGGNGGSGGWAFNVLGGSLDIATTFDFSNITNGDSSPVGYLTIGSIGSATGGTVNIGTMSADWDDRPGQYVLFNDSLGSLTFGMTNYSNIADVEALITGDFIRKDAGVTGNFDIANDGTSWTVTVVPEPGTYALLAGCFALASVMVRRRRA